MDYRLVGPPFEQAEIIQILDDDPREIPALDHPARLVQVPGGIAGGAGRETGGGRRDGDSLQIEIHATAPRHAQRVIVLYQALIIGMIRAWLDHIKVVHPEAVPDFRNAAQRLAQAGNVCPGQPRAQRAEQHALAYYQTPLAFQWSNKSI